MSDEELAELRAAAEAATPGPWAQHPSARGAVHQPEFECWIPAGEADAAYIAAANPAAILRLLAHVEALKARVAERDALLRECSDWLATSGNDCEIEVSAKVDALLGPEKPAQVAPGG